MHGKEKIHDKFTRAKGSFKAVMQSIEVANKLRVPISAVASIIQLNFHEIIDIARICENKGVDKLYFFTLIARGRGAGIYNNQYISYEKVQRKFEELQDIAQKEHWKLKMNLIDWDREGQCVLLFPNGDLVGVPSFQDKENTKIIGNLFKDSGRSLWERYPFKKNYIAYYRNH